MPMKESVGVAKEATSGVPMKQDPMEGLIVIETDTRIDSCCFLYLLKHTLCKTPILSRIIS